MREVKFRVFDKDTKRMHVCGEDIHDSMTFINNQACYYNLQNGCGSLPEHEGEGTYELMQYTGLKDKNGKEIYEGDVVEFKSMSKIERHCVEYSEYGEWCVGMHRLPMRFQTCEVVGNIYENPELLETK
ncbi:YopX family protein [Bacillus chungangensis]|uniref:Phage protein (TIGR01671 family) n=1 Tax=Bacillus chungangensis TaxID=587633 RepID=A0ABT9WRV3_9BACI|nr:YopX family protein [Bacillus chungangensis]MDQ0176031.1 putative phage protein (TIGR01671 family) [Bacillus chungangensis]